MDIFGFFSLPDWVLALFILTALLYIYGTWNFGYFEKLGIKTDKPLPLLGNVHTRYIGKYVHEADKDCYERLGKIHGIYEGRQPIYFIGDPEIIKLLLVKNFNHFTDRRHITLSSESNIIQKFLILMRGEEWRITRHVLTPTFTTGKLKQMSHLMEECALQSSEKTVYKLIPGASNSLDMKMEIGFYSMNVIASCAFGFQLNCDSVEDPFFKHSKSLFGNDLSIRLALIVMIPRLAKLLKVQFFPLEFLRYFSNISKKIINLRKTEGIRRTDFLQLLLDAQIEEEKGINVDANRNGKLEDVHKKVLDEDCVIAQSMLFLLGGFDTVASTVSFMLHSLALKPELQDRLYEEIQEVKRKNNGKIPPEAIMQMEYLEMVFAETLRFYPINTRLERQCTSDCTLAGIPFKKGQVAAIPVYALHHDDKYFPEPEKFDPERFSPDNRQYINPYAYLPFGAGPRNCIGMRFAQMQSKIGIVHFLDKFHFSRSQKTEVPIKMKRGLAVLSTENGVWLHVDKR